MVKQKKKAPGRPKKEFVSKKTKTQVQAWPGRPRKNQEHAIDPNQIPPAIVWHVEKSVDDSKRKDMVILLLFLLSFILFVVSLYFTFMRDQKANTLTQDEIAEITNIETGNIDYTMPISTEMPPVEDQETVVIDTTTPPVEQNVTSEQQMIIDFYQAVNTIDMSTIYTLTEGRLEESNVFKTYYNKRWLSMFSEVVLAPKITVTNIQEKSSIDNPDIKNFTYTLEYTIARNQQKFTEERSTVLIKKWDDRRIGKLMCETKGCSMMPFFNPEKYK